jgi:hypothetical protein
VIERRLRRLAAAKAPGEEEAGERAWPVVRAAFETRERAGRAPLLRGRAPLALAVLAVLVAAALTPPGRAVLGELREAIGRERVTPSRPALSSLPTGGRLLVISPRGAWIVEKDGSKRRLGAYEEATWSPRGLFVGATRGRTLVAITPRGDVRWSLSRERVSQPRWSPSGFRVVYRSRGALRLVAGDGTGDRRLSARGLDPAAPAWRPGTGHVIAYADRRGRVHVVDTDTGRTLWTTRRLPDVRALEWSDDGLRLLAQTRRSVQTFEEPGKSVTTITISRNQVVTGAAFKPGGHALAYLVLASATGTSRVFVAGETGAAVRRFEGAGRLRDLTWSPNGRWLLVGWPRADQLLFLGMGDRRIVAVSNVSREFDPGGIGPAGFPRVAGWCCRPSR